MKARNRWPVFLFLLSIASFSSFIAFDFFLETRFNFPQKIVPGRHFTLSPVRENLGKLFAWSDGQGEIHLPDFQPTPELALPIGMRILLGTEAIPTSKCFVEAAFYLSGSHFNCNTRGSVSIRNDTWNTFALKCEPASPGSSLEPKNSFKLHSCNPTLPRFALYSGTSGKDNTNGAALELLTSHYPSDKAPVSWSEAKQFGVIWNSKLHKSLDFGTQIALSLTLPFLFFAGVSIRKKKYFWSALALFGIWLVFTFSVAFKTPPFQHPDEPQHFQGLISKLPEASLRERLHNHGLDLAAATHFNEITKTRNVVVRFDKIGERSWGGEHSFAADPQNRSRWYAMLSENITPVAIKIWDKVSSNLNDLVFILRMNLLGCAALLVFACAVFHAKANRPFSLVLMFLMLLIPVNVSLTSSISNYGLAIVLGACTGGLIFPEGSLRTRIASSALSGFALFFLASSSSPCQLLFLIGPALLLAWPWTLGIPAKRRVGLYLGLLSLSCFLIPVLISIPWISLNSWFPSYYDFRSKLNFESVPGLSHLEFLIPNSWIGFALAGSIPGVFLCLLPLKSRVGNIKKQLILTALALSVFFAILCSSYLFFPNPEFAPNIRFLVDATPSFFDFLKSVSRAWFSQIFSESQDYYLWQTYIMAYGWLDSAGSPFVYVSLKQCVLLLIGGGVVALFWRTLPWIRLCLIPFLFGIALWLGALYGAWSQFHTLLGRYAAPFEFLFIIPLIAGVALCLPHNRGRRQWNGGIVLAFLGLTVLVFFNLYGVAWILPKRFLVGP